LWGLVVVVGGAVVVVVAVAGSGGGGGGVLIAPGPRVTGARAGPGGCPGSGATRGRHCGSADW
jgi:hypothetical protein